MELVEGAVSAANKLKWKKLALHERKLNKIAEENIAEGFDPDSEKPPNDEDEEEEIQQILEEEIALGELLGNLKEVLSCKEFNLSMSDHLGCAIFCDQ